MLHLCSSAGAPVPRMAEHVDSGWGGRDADDVLTQVTVLSCTPPLHLAVQLDHSLSSNATHAEQLRMTAAGIEAPSHSAESTSSVLFGKKHLSVRTLLRA